MYLTQSLGLRPRDASFKKDQGLTSMHVMGTCNTFVGLHARASNPQISKRPLHPRLVWGNRLLPGAGRTTPYSGFQLLTPSNHLMYFTYGPYGVGDGEDVFGSSIGAPFHSINSSTVCQLRCTQYVKTDVNKCPDRIRPG